jgi:L-idonate 5-dehydrogenase
MADYRYTLHRVSATSPQIRESFQGFAIRGREDGALISLDKRAPAPDEIRIHVGYVGICGSDLHYYFSGANGSFVIKELLIPGHEVSGVIDVDPLGEFATGTPVAIFPAQSGELIPGLEDRPHLWQGVRYLGSAATTPHTQGAMAQYLYVKREMVRPLPKGVSLKSGALAEPLAVAIHGVKLAGEIRNKGVLITGAGPIGLLMVVAAKDAGAKSVTITDVFDEPLARATSLGADNTINVSRETQVRDSYEVIFECSGNMKAVNSAISAVQRGGTIVQVGMIGQDGQGVDIGLVVTKELRFYGAFRFNHEMDEAISLLEKKPELENCISHIFAISDVVEAFELARDPQLSGKVLVSLI